LRKAATGRDPAQIEKEGAMLAFIQLDTGQSGYGVRYRRLTFGLYMPWLASMATLMSRLI
jgi:hypothetical protein